MQAVTLLDGPIDFKSKPGNPEVSAKQPRYLYPATPASPMVRLEPVDLLVEVEAMVEEVALALEEAAFMLADVVVAWLVGIAAPLLVVVLE